MLKQRILTALIAVIIVAAALFLLPQWATRLIVATLMLIAAWEWSGLLSMHSPVLRAAYVGLIAFLTGAVFWLVPGTLQSEQLFELAVAWWLLAFIWLFFHPMSIPPFLGGLCGALTIVPAWYAVDWLYLHGNVSLMLVLLIVICADTGAYFAGKFIGRVKLAPKISPGKTWEGVIGGMIVVSILAAAVASLNHSRAVVTIPMFLAIAILSIVGDLTVSAFKRNAGVKDSGHFFPGHGGVLDRIDSVAAAAPAFALLTAMGATG